MECGRKKNTVFLTEYYPLLSLLVTSSLYLLIVGVEVIAAPDCTIGHTHSVGLVYTRCWSVAEICNCTTHNIRKRQTSVHSAGFKPRNPSKQAAADLGLRPRDHRNRSKYC